MSLGQNINVLQGMTNNLDMQVFKKMSETFFEFAPTVDNPKYTDYVGTLTMWQSNAERILQQCRVIQGELNLCKPKAAHGPIPRHGGTIHNHIHNLTKGAIKSEELKLGRVVEQVSKIKDNLLHMLYDKTDPIALANSLGDNAKDFVKQLKAIDHVGVSTGKTTAQVEVRKYEPMHGGGDPLTQVQDITTAVALLVGLALHWLKNR